MSVMEDIHSNRTKPWVQRKVTAMVEGFEVGYLRTAYAPKKMWEETFPTIWHFAQIMTGLKTINPEGTIQEMWAEIRRYSGYSSHKVEDMDIWAIEFRERMGVREQHHVDKPVVDYIGVRPYQDQRIPDLGINFQRQRIGLALYEFTARHLAEQGLTLWASGVQSEEAQACWEWMEKNGYPIKHDMTGPHPRKNLDYR